MSWGALPLWYGFIIPIIYITYRKLLPDQNATDAASMTFFQRIRNFLTLPKISNYIIYGSILLIIIGTVTLKIDQNQKEKIRNNGQRIKKYLESQNLYSLADKDLIGNLGLQRIKLKDLDDVIELFPSEFIRIGGNTVLLVDSITYLQILQTSVHLLDSYLSNSTNQKGYFYSYDTLHTISTQFTRQVIDKLIVDSSKKYSFSKINMKESIEIK